jgi:hypothetical protein
MYLRLTYNLTRHTELIVAFPLQQWLRVTMLRYTYSVCLVRISVAVSEYDTV